MPTDPPVPPASAPVPRRSWAARVLTWLLALLAVAALAVAGYFVFALNYAYSTGERAGYVQKFSRRGWVCKTWEGELAVVNLPGAVPEIFTFSVRDDGIARQVSATMGNRVVLSYDQHPGLPSCVAETSYFVTTVRKQDDAPK